MWKGKSQANRWLRKLCGSAQNPERRHGPSPAAAIGVTIGREWMAGAGPPRPRPSNQLLLNATDGSMLAARYASSSVTISPRRRLDDWAAGQDGSVVVLSADMPNRLHAAALASIVVGLAATGVILSAQATSSSAARLTPPTTPEEVASTFIGYLERDEVLRAQDLMEPGLRQAVAATAREMSKSSISKEAGGIPETLIQELLIGELFGIESDNTSDPNVTTTGRTDTGPSTCVVVCLVRRPVKGAGGAVRTRLRALSLSRTADGWRVVSPGGESDLAFLRAVLAPKIMSMLGSLLAMRTGAATFSESVEVPKPSPASLKLISITPAAGTAVTRETVLIAELEYTIEQFAPGRFEMDARFATTREAITQLGDFEALLLERPNGRVTIKYPLAAIWSKDVRRPLEVQFCIGQKIGFMGSTAAAACTPFIKFR